MKSSKNSGNNWQARGSAHLVSDTSFLKVALQIVILGAHPPRSTTQKSGDIRPVPSGIHLALCHSSEEIGMSDFIFVTLSILLFGLGIGFAHFCQKLK